MKNNKKENKFFTDDEHYTENFEYSEYDEEDVKEIEALEASISLDAVDKILCSAKVKKRLGILEVKHDFFEDIDTKTNNYIVLMRSHFQNRSIKAKNSSLFQNMTKLNPMAYKNGYFQVFKSVVRDKKTQSEQNNEQDRIEIKN